MSNSNNVLTDSEIRETELRLIRLREQKQREEEERKRVEEEEHHKAEEERLWKEEAERRKAEAKVRKAEEKKVRAEEARKKKEREDEVKKAKARKAKVRDSEESGDDEEEAEEEEVVGDKRKWSANQDCASCLKKEIECVWPASGSKKQKSCTACHVTKIKCFVGEKLAKKARSKKADKATFVELDSQDGALDFIAESFRSMAEDIKGISGLLRAHYDLGKATLNAHRTGYSNIADKIYHFQVLMGYWRAELEEQEAPEEEGEVTVKGDNAEGSAKDNGVDGS
jgi:hypothetical protein